MTRASKICLSVAGVVLLLLVAAVVTVDSWVTYVARNEVAQALEGQPISLTFRRIHFEPFVGNIYVHGIEMEMKNDSVEVSMSIDCFSAGRMDYERAAETHGGVLVLHDLSIEGVNMQSAFPHPEGRLGLSMQDANVGIQGIMFSNGVDSTLEVGLVVDSVWANLAQMGLHLTKTHAPNAPYGTPQGAFANIPLPLDIKHIHAHVNQFDFELTTPDVPYSKISMDNAVADISSVSNAKDNKMRTYARTHLTHGGYAYVNMTLCQNRQEDVAMDVLVVGAHGSMVDDMIRPMVGITAALEIDTLRSNIRGNKHSVDGEFVMRYHDMKITAHAGESPYQIINKNADAITFFGNLLLPNANPNPLCPEDVRRYRVHADRNVMQPYPLFLIWPIVDGLKDTMLPGLFVSKRVKHESVKPQAIKSQATKTKPVKAQPSHHSAGSAR